jgi:ribose transport system permease protein
LLAGALIGGINGFSVAKFKMVPMIVTLAISTIASGISNWHTEAKSISGMPDSFRNSFGGNIAGIPVPALILIFFAFVMHMILSRTIFGRSIYGVGVNEKTARVNGVPTTKIIFFSYLISGSLAGMAGVVASARLNSAGPSMGPQAMFMDIVCAVVLGGASINGGKGTIFGTIIGSIFIATLSNVMNMLNVEFLSLLS